MHHARAILAAAAAVGLLATGTAALGHGESGHGKPKAFDPAKVEQKPFGRAGNPRNAKRTIHIAMNDRMQFVAGAHATRKTDVGPGNPPHAMPGNIEVKRGETVRFVVRNDGQVMHEMVLGTMQELKGATWRPA
jgi:uncharacterized cupredoxin-like copper-binding protein